MNVYDFDNTIYRGDSTLRFYLYCARHYPRCLCALPRLLPAALQYALGLISKTVFKQTLFGFVRHIPQDAPQRFWEEEITRIQPWYRAQMRSDDLVISAGPEFLIAPACALLGIAHPIASQVDARTGQYTGHNCDGEEKPRRFRAQFGDAEIEAFYSDSPGDAPMAALARQAYRVQGGVISAWQSDKLQDSL